MEKPTHTRAPEVWKFCRRALADAAAVVRAVALVAAHRGPRVIVASALAGVTDLLLQGARAALTGASPDAAHFAALFLRQHREIVKALLPPGKVRSDRLADVDAAAREYHQL